jgi:hypothetical protein
MNTNAHAAARAALMRELLPALLHDIGNTTQRIVGVRALLDLDERSLLGAAGEDLAWASERAREQGWLMGLAAAGLGVDLLLERRWSEGLRATVSLAASALARHGGVCRFARAELPQLDPAADGPGDSALCLGLAQVVIAAGLTKERQVLELLGARRGAHFALCGSVGAEGAQGAFEIVRDELGGRAVFEREGDAWSVLLPASWFRS